MQRAFLKHKIKISEKDIAAHITRATGQNQIELVLREINAGDGKMAKKIYNTYCKELSQNIEKFCELTEGTYEAYDLLK
jgi:hypothetical protein